MPKTEKSGNSLTMNVHPLLVDLIVDKIFNYLDPAERPLSDEERLAYIKNVQNIRLVCKVWKERITIVFREENRMTISFGGSDLCTDAGIDLRLKQFVEVMKNSDIIPIQEYCLLQGLFYPVNAVLLKNFLKIVGPSVENLYFRIRDMCTPEIFSDVSKLHLNRLRTLDIFCISYGEHHPLHSPNGTSRLIAAFLTAAPNLKDFALRVDRKNIENLDKMFRSIPKSVQTLNLEVPLLFDSHFEGLTEANAAIEECSISSHKIDCPKQKHREFFSLLSQSLKRLNLFQSPSKLLLQQFPKLVKLQNLKVECEHEGKFFGDISIPDIFPNLIRLDIEEVHSEDLSLKLISNQGVSSSVQELSLSSHCPQVQVVKNAAHIFPNLRKLYINSSESIIEIIQAVFQHLQTIEELSIDFGFNDDASINGDSLLSGVPKTICKQISRQGDFSNFKIETVRQQPSLCNLQKLRKLEISDCVGVTCTDFSVHFTFLELRSLEELHLPYLEASKTYALILQKKLKVLQVAETLQQS